MDPQEATAFDCPDPPNGREVRISRQVLENLVAVVEAQTGQLRGRRGVGIKDAIEWREKMVAAAKEVIANDDSDLAIERHWAENAARKSTV